MISFLSKGDQGGRREKTHHTLLVIEKKRGKKEKKKEKASIFTSVQEPSGRKEGGIKSEADQSKKRNANLSPLPPGRRKKKKKSRGKETGESPTTQRKDREKGKPTVLDASGEEGTTVACSSNKKKRHQSLLLCWTR